MSLQLIVMCVQRGGMLNLVSQRRSQAGKPVRATSAKTSQKRSNSQSVV